MGAHAHHDLSGEEELSSAAYVIGRFGILRNSLEKIIIPFRGVLREGRQTSEIRSFL
jgi:hypothetical protein